jgi:crossover junction endodeoxyribonuclease RuvC
VTCGAIATPAGAALPDRLRIIHDRLSKLIRTAGPDCVVVENLFHARNVRSALILGHARGVAVLAAVQADVPVVEYTPAEVKLALVGYGRAEKQQISHMVKLLLGLASAPAPHDASDALAVAICHLHTSSGAIGRTGSQPRRLTSWRHARLPHLARRSAP